MNESQNHLIEEWFSLSEEELFYILIMDESTEEQMENAIIVLENQYGYTQEGILSKIGGAAAKGIGIAEKEILSCTIPDLWKIDKQKVLNHVANDSYLTLQITRYILNFNCLPWITLKGSLKTWNPVSLSTVRNCLQMPVPKVKFEIQNHVNPKVLSRWIFEL